jgi:enoyl-CoA hydratase/carnithine racemase
VDDRPDRVLAVLDRPEQRNAIDQPTIRELHAVCAELEERPRPLLITGTGEWFAAGADIAELRVRGRDDALRRHNAALFDRIARLPQPTVAAVNGPAIGGGAELAYACDIRLAADGAYFSNPEPGLGVLAAGGAAWRLAELVGRSVAKQVLLGGYRIGAADALRLGLVAEVVAREELADRAEHVLARIARQSAVALRLTKLVVDAPAAHPLADDLAQAVLFESSDKGERMDAFLNRSSQ